MSQMKRSTTFVIISVIAAVMLLAAGYLAFRSIFPVATLTEISKMSPDRQHMATLVTREAGFDVNVVLEIDGATVYVSPDFVAPATADFQEHLMWDRGGTVVLLEVAGKRLFGYDVRHRRPLTASELSIVPLSSFDDLRFTR